MATIRISSRTWLHIALVIFVVAASVYAHVTLGFVCPLPWPDESHFLWPAISFAEQGTFYSPELNPERTIYWMPPGYATVIAGLFTITGPSLVVARFFSLICVLLSFVFFLRILRRLDFSFLSSVLAGWFFLNAYFVACGNIARMEALLLLVALSAFALLFDRKTVFALGLLSLTPLIHPNGFYFLIAAIAYATFYSWRTGTRPTLTKPAIVLLAIVVVCWIGYAVNCIAHWELVTGDLAFQFARKSERSILGQTLTLDNLALLIMLVGALMLSFSGNRRRFSLLVLAIPCWAADVIGFEMWYRVFWMLAALIITILFVESVGEFIRTRLDLFHRYVRAVMVGLLIYGVVVWHYYRQNLESPAGYPFHMQFFEMSVPDGVPYLTADDKQKVRDIIFAEAAIRPITVQFFPRAEALFYLSLRSDRIRLSDPLFYKKSADLYILHESKHLAPRWQWFLANDMKEAGLDPKSRWNFIVFERDDHERWYAVRRQAE